MINVPKEAKIGGYSSHHFQRLQESAKIRVNECEYTENWKNVFADVCIFFLVHPENRVIGFVLLPISPAELGKTTNTTFTTSNNLRTLVKNRETIIHIG